MAKGEQQLSLDGFDAEALAEHVHHLEASGAQIERAKEQHEEALSGIGSFIPFDQQSDFDVDWTATVETPEGARKTVKAKRPVVVEWDQEALAEICQQLEAEGHDLSGIVTVKRSITDKALRSAPPHIAHRLSQARTLSAHKKDGTLRKPSVRVEDAA